jgi:hypothetical protein
VYRLKTEIISVSKLTRSLLHITSTEVKEVRFDKDTLYQEAVQYIDQYVTQNEFRILNASSEPTGFMYFLVKDDI